MRVYLDRDEFWPWFGMDDSKHSWGTMVEIPEELYTRYRQILGDAVEVQAELSKLYEQATKEF